MKNLLFNCFRAGLCLLVSFIQTNVVLAASSSFDVVQGRTEISLNGEWKFTTDPVGGAEKDNRGVIKAGQVLDPMRVTPGEEAGYFKTNFDDSDWDTMAVPGVWDVQDRYSDYFDNSWYRTSFDLAPQSGKRISIHFDAVYYQTEVWLNGERIGHHIGGFTPFEFDISDKLSANGINTLAMRVNNVFRQGAWWPWGGISRDVTLRIDPQVYIERQEVIATPDLDQGSAEIEVTATLVNLEANNQRVSVSGAIKDIQGRALVNLAAVNNEIEVPAGESVEFTLTATMSADQYELWHFDNPALYFSEIELVKLDDNNAAYTIRDRFGIRHIDMTGGIFKLNDEVVRLVGFNRVSDDRVNGSVEPTYVIRRDLDRMKAAGTNMTRIHHVPQAKEIIEYADEIGILLISEVPIFGNADISENNVQTPNELRELIRRDFNHPSIIGWSVANEIPASTDESRAFIQRMVNLSKSLDPTRPTTFARKSAGGVGSNDSLQFVDFPSVNLYGGFAGGTNKISSLWPNRPVLVTEFSSDGYQFGTERETLEHLTKTGDVVHTWDAQPKVMGASVWSYNDYRSEFYGTSINQTRGWGVQDTWGNLKAGYKLAQDGFAPVADLTLIPAHKNTSEHQTIIKLTPRSTPNKSIPSFALSGYRLLWQALGENDQVLAGYIVGLPEILPGSEARSWSINWEEADLSETLLVEKVSLINPLGYEVKVTFAESSFPAKPKIDQLHLADGAVRATFTPVTGATHYILEATGGGRSLSASVQKSHSIELTGLANNVTYDLRLLAVNGFGGSPSQVHQATPTEDLGSLAPIIQAITPIKAGFVLGFIKSPGDNKQWEVEVNELNAGQVVNSETYLSNTIGATRKEGLKENQEYQVRIRNTDNGAWSEYAFVTTLGGSNKPELKVEGILSGESSLVVRIKPHPMAVRYHIEAQSNAGSVTKVFEHGAIDTLLLKGLNENTEYTVNVSVETFYGMSDSVQIIGATQPSKIAEFSPLMVIVSSDDAGYEEISGTWGDSVAGGRYSRSANANASWTTQVPETSRYQVEVYVPDNGSASNQASYTVVHASGEETVVRDQYVIQEDWNVLGTWDFNATDNAMVRLTAPDGILRADRVRFVKVYKAEEEVVELEQVSYDPDSSEYREVSGSWSTTSIEGSNLRFSRSEGAIAGWDLSVPKDARYKVEVRIDSTDNSTSQQTFTIPSDSGSSEVVIDQKATSGNWVSLGAYNFSQGRPYELRFTNSDGKLLRAHELRLTEEIPLVINPNQ